MYVYVWITGFHAKLFRTISNHRRICRSNKFHTFPPEKETGNQFQKSNQKSSMTITINILMTIRQQIGMITMTIILYESSYPNEQKVI